MKYIDLTQPFTRQMPVYPGDPTSELIQTAFIDKDGYNDYQIKTGMHVGTHMDAPLHMLSGGKMINDIFLEKFFGDGHLIDARKKSVIDVDLLNEVAIKKGDIVLVMTGFYKKYRDKDYFEKYPEISEKFAAKLVKLGVSIVGVDTPSPDREPFNVHKLLLKNDILIIENLTNLENLLNIDNFKLVALPINLNAEAAPVRVVAIIS